MLNKWRMMILNRSAGSEEELCILAKALKSIYAGVYWVQIERNYPFNIRNHLTVDGDVKILDEMHF